MRITVDLSGLADQLSSLKLVKESLPDITRELSSSLVPTIHDRIHSEGKDASGSQIGTYSEKYLKTRERKSRKDGSKVILSLTRKLEQAIDAVKGDDGLYGIGVKTEQRPEGTIGNTELIRILEEKYGKKIYDLTKEEQKQAEDFIQKKIDQLLK